MTNLLDQFTGAMQKAADQVQTAYAAMPDPVQNLAADNAALSAEWLQFEEQQAYNAQPDYGAAYDFTQPIPEYNYVPPSAPQSYPMLPEIVAPTFTRTYDASGPVSEPSYTLDPQWYEQEQFDAAINPELVSPSNGGLNAAGRAIVGMDTPADLIGTDTPFTRSAPIDPFAAAIRGINAVSDFVDRTPITAAAPGLNILANRLGLDVPTTGEVVDEYRNRAIDAAGLSARYGIGPVGLLPENVARGAADIFLPRSTLEVGLELLPGIGTVPDLLRGMDTTQTGVRALDALPSSRLTRNVALEIPQYSDEMAQVYNRTAGIAGVAPNLPTRQAAQLPFGTQMAGGADEAVTAAWYGWDDATKRMSEVPRRVPVPNPERFEIPNLEDLQLFIHRTIDSAGNVEPGWTVTEAVSGSPIYKSSIAGNGKDAKEFIREVLTQKYADPQKVAELKEGIADPAALIRVSNQLGDLRRDVDAAYRTAAQTPSPSSLPGPVSPSNPAQGTTPSGLSAGLPDAAAAQAGSTPAPPSASPPLPPSSAVPPAGGSPMPPPANPADYPGIAAAKEAAEGKVPALFNVESGVRPNILRRVGGQVVPGLKAPRQVQVANQARSYVAAQVTSFTDPQLAAARSVDDAFKATPPVYKGASQSPAVGSPAHYLERWWEYDASDALMAARQQWDEAFDGSLVRLRDEYGVEINPYRPAGPNGERGSYVPHMESSDVLDARRKAGELGPERETLGTGKVAIEKERGIPTIEERMAFDPDWVPELDIQSLATRHGAMQADAASRATYKALINGKTEMQLLEEAHPQLLRWRETATRRVANTRKTLANARRRLNQSGISEERIQREIADVKAREARAAGRIDAVADDGMEAITSLRQELDDLLAEAKAHENILRQLEAEQVASDARSVRQHGRKAGALTARETAAESSANTLAQVRKTLEDEQRKALEALGLAEEQMALTSAANRMRLTPAQNTARLGVKVKQLQARVDAINALRQQIGGQQSRASARVQKLMDDIAALGDVQTPRLQGAEAPPAPSQSQITALERRIKAAEDAAVKEVMENIGRQKELSVQTTKLTNELTQATNAAKRNADQAERLVARLEKEVADLSEARQAVRTANRRVVNGKVYAFDPVTNQWVTPDVARASAEISRSKTGGLLNVMEEARSIQLNGGDLSPVTYGRAQMGAMGNLSTTARMVTHPREVARAITTNQVWDGVDPEMLSVYQGLRGRSVRQPLSEVRPDDAKRGLERIPRLGTGIRAVNDAANRFATYGDYLAWENSVRSIMRRKPDLSLAQAGAEAMKAMDNIAARVDLSKLGISSAAQRLINAPFTSLSYMGATPQLAASYTRAGAKLTAELAKAKGNPLAAWRALGAADQETLIHGSELIASITALAAASNVAFGDDTKSIERRLKESANPLHGDWWMFKTPFGDIPLATPLRSSVRMGVRTYQGKNDAPVNYVTNRLLSAPSFVYHMLANEDWKGDEIRSGSLSNQIKQSILYGMESASIATSAPIRAVRTGEGGSLGEIAGETFTNQVGIPFYEPSTYSKRDAMSRERFGMDYDDASVIYQAMVNKEMAHELEDWQRARPYWDITDEAFDQLKQRSPLLSQLGDFKDLQDFRDTALREILKRDPMMPRQNAERIVEKMEEALGLPELIKIGREGVIRADTGIVDALQRQYNAGELEYPPPKWAIELAKELNEAEAEQLLTEPVK